jgi:hypothetical protein
VRAVVGRFSGPPESVEADEQPLRRVAKDQIE